MRRTPRNILIGVGVVLTGAMSFMVLTLMTSFGGYIDMPFDGEVLLSGPVVDTWSVPAFAAAPVVLPGASWASIPARGADGSVAGWVHEGGQGSFVKLDERSGAVQWRLATGPVPASMVRSDGWRAREVAPAVALTLAGEGQYLVAWSRTWLLVAGDGRSFKTGNFPDAVPEVAPFGGVCLVDGQFWIGIADGRDGGVMLSPAGVLADVRSDRPATCLGAGGGGEGAISPLQNAHADPGVYAADDRVRGYPEEVCGKSNKGSRKKGREYCDQLRTDGPIEQAVMMHISNLVFRDGADWLTVRLPHSFEGGVDFHPQVTGFELAWPRAFFDMVEYRNTVTENDPAAGSFEARKVEKGTEVIEVIASVARSGELQWARSVERGPLASVSATFRDNMVQSQSLLLASHPGSAVQNLYVFKPGMLLAVDQVSGAPRFQVGAAYPAAVVAVTAAPDEL